MNFSHTMLHGTRRGAIHRARAESVAAIGLFRRCRAVHAIKKRPMRGASSKLILHRHIRRRAVPGQNDAVSPAQERQ